jgi:Cof subfamily protein (haloacid dehalogenase superfamily)
VNTPVRPPWTAGGLPRLIATDLDGTLIGRDYLVSPRGAQALARAAAAGMVVVLVTGRPVRWLGHVYGQLAAEYLAVCANGAVVYDPGTDAVLDSWPLSPQLLGGVCARLRAAIPGVVFAAEVSGGRVLKHEPAWPLRYEASTPDVYAVGPAELVAEPAVKLLARDGERDSDEFTALIESLVDGTVEATHSSRSGLVEMSARGVTKATGLAAVADELGIAAAEVLAFGDMPNDVPMLRWAGRSVAVRNAHPAARAAADEVTESNVDDGVAGYLERLGV